MLPKPAKTSANAVGINISDNQGGVEKRINGSLERPLHDGGGVELQGQRAISQTSSSYKNPMSESRSFWKAGAYDIGPTKSALGQDQLEHARVHPKFLHSNATSHKWAFGAIAELLDNAVDEICNGATFVKVDKICNTKDNSPALLFQDDGGGMDPDCIRKCMSLGYSSKKTKMTIGQYGNGFKTSTMRLGADVIVFSRSICSSRATQSIGLLSYTFLRRTGQDDVIIPMVDFEVMDQGTEPIIYSSLDDWHNNLNIILQWSPFASRKELMHQFEDLGPHGTKMMIYNLWLNDEGVFELSFDDDDEDIRLRDEASQGSLSRAHNKLVESHISYCMRYSLRVYASLLYLRKFANFHIILRGKPVEQFNIADELKFPKVVVYRPQIGMASKEVSVETTIGFVKEAPIPVSGFNVYHKNRLIRPFWKVTSEGSSAGHGVVGFLEANFIEPAHDKQDFERSTLFIRLEMRLKQMIIEYWRSHCHLILQPHSPAANLHGMQQKECPTDRPSVGFAANTHKQVPCDQRDVGLSAYVQEEMDLDQPIIGLPANLSQGLSNAQSGAVLMANFQEESLAGQPVRLVAGMDKEVAPVNTSQSVLVDRILEENLQLFMRCEEHVKKEEELKQTIGELEGELKEAKRKYAWLSSRLENQRKLKRLKQLTEVKQSN